MTRHTIDSGDVSVQDIDVRKLDYIVVSGEVFRVRQDEHGAAAYLVELEEMPEEYWNRWDC